MEQIRINDVLGEAADVYSQNYYRITGYKTSVLYMPKMSEGKWWCTCGAENIISENTCIICGISVSTLHDLLDPDRLREKNDTSNGSLRGSKKTTINESTSAESSNTSKMSLSTILVGLCAIFAIIAVVLFVIALVMSLNKEKGSDSDFTLFVVSLAFAGCSYIMYKINNGLLVNSRTSEYTGKYSGDDTSSSTNNASVGKKCFCPMCSSDDVFISIETVGEHSKGYSGKKKKCSN